MGGAGGIVDQQLDGQGGAVGADTLHSSLQRILASLGCSLRRSSLLLGLKWLVQQPGEVRGGLRDEARSILVGVVRSEIEERWVAEGLVGRLSVRSHMVSWLEGRQVAVGIVEVTVQPGSEGRERIGLSRLEHRLE